METVPNPLRLYDQVIDEVHRLHREALVSPLYPYLSGGDGRYTEAFNLLCESIRDEFSTRDMKAIER